MNTTSDAAGLDPDAWRRLWRLVLGALFGGAAGIVAVALVAEIAAVTLPSASHGGAGMLGAVLGFWMGRSSNLRRRWIAALTTGGALGLGLGWVFERAIGAVIGFALGVAAATLLVWGVEALLRHIPTRWLCAGFWAALAAVMTSAGIALLLRFATGRLDDDDFAFHVTAIVVVCYWAARTGWLAEPRASGAAVRAQLHRMMLRFMRSPAFPFAVAVVAAGAVAGPAEAEYLVEETSATLSVRRNAAFLAWPAALVAAAAWIAWRRRRAPAGPALAVIAVLVALACAYSAYSVATYRITADLTRLQVGSKEVLRADLVKIGYERVTSRRHVFHQPVLVLEGGKFLDLGHDSGSSSAVRFLERAWGTPVGRPR